MIIRLTVEQAAATAVVARNQHKHKHKNALLKPRGKKIAGALVDIPEKPKKTLHGLVSQIAPMQEAMVACKFAKRDMSGKCLVTVAASA